MRKGSRRSGSFELKKEKDGLKEQDLTAWEEARGAALLGRVRVPGSRGGWGSQGADDGDWLFIAGPASEVVTSGTSSDWKLRCLFVLLSKSLFLIRIYLKLNPALRMLFLDTL